MAEEIFERIYGRGYTPMNGLWTPVRERFNNGFQNFCRSEQEASNTGIEAYAKLAAGAKEVKTELAQGGNMSLNDKNKYVDIGSESSFKSDGSQASNGESNEGSGSGSGSQQSNTPTTIPRDLLRQPGASRGHCFPADRVCVGAYGVLGQGIVGAPEIENVEYGGSRDDAIVALRTLVYGIRKVAKGLKNLPQNAIPLPDNHGGKFDDESVWGMVPCMTMGQARGWDGGEYWALFLAGNKTQQVTRDLRDIDEAEEPDAYQEAYNESTDAELFQSFFRANVEENNVFMERCTPEDIRNATTLLSDCVKAIADVVDRDDLPADPKDTGSDSGVARGTVGKKSRRKAKTCPIAPSELLFSKKEKNAEAVNKKREFCKRAKQVFLKNGTVEVPSLPRDLNLENVHVVKVRVRKIQGIDGIADPLMLALKAAVNWSNRMAPAVEPALKLLPACGPVVAPLDDDSSDGAIEIPWVDEASRRFSAQPFVVGNEELQPIGGMMLTRFLEEQKDISRVSLSPQKEEQKDIPRVSLSPQKD